MATPTALTLSSTPASALTSGDVIESLTGKRHVSWSQLSSFRGCPRKWWFSHVEGAQPAFIPAALLFGSAFHDAVQEEVDNAIKAVQKECDDLLSRETEIRQQSEKIIARLEPKVNRLHALRDKAQAVIAETQGKEFLRV